ncbi:MAG: tail fiber domain-containing protein [Heliobacteriaceae bacterium]|nr:tail fiber domain-containing protein [Heliobacteriaceae bacterium]
MNTGNLEIQVRGAVCLTAASPQTLSSPFGFAKCLCPLPQGEGLRIFVPPSRGNRNLQSKFRRGAGFTLAEMMIVLLVMTIILAAFAPLMTRRMKSNMSGGGGGSLWSELTTNGPGIYYGTGNAENVIIGAATKATDDNARLILKKGTTSQNYMLFKDTNGLNLAGLHIEADRVMYFGGVPVVKTGGMNTGFGCKVLSSNTVGSNNTGAGFRALSVNTSGSENTGVGSYTLYSNTTGGKNTGLGYAALSSNTTGSNNTGVGPQALYSSTTGSNNTGVGYQALYKNTTGRENTSLGDSALYSNTTGHSNTGVGLQALYSNTTGTYNTGVGLQALYKNTGSDNTGLGGVALNSNTTGSSNTGVGAQALRYNSTGGNNTGVGMQALPSNTSGNYNTGAGYRVLYNNTGGSNNTGVGMQVLYRNTTGSDNTGLGNSACAWVTSGTNKTCIGYGSGPSSGTWTTDSQERIFIGSKSKYNGGVAPLEVHNLDTNNSFSSYGVSFTGVDGSAHNRRNETAVVVNGALIVHGPIINNVKTEGNSNFAWSILEVNNGSNNDAHWAYNTGSGHPLVSDARLKNIKGENTNGLEKIKQIKVFNYTMKKDKLKTPRVGVIAQDLRKVFPNAVAKGSDGFLNIRTEDILYALVNAVKELDKNIKEMLKQVQHDAAAVQTRVAKLEKENKQLKAQNKALEARLSRLEAKINRVE